MQFLAQLWLPILVTAVVLFFCSFLLWAVLPHHKDDWSKLPDEEGFRQHLKGLNLPSGAYIFPKMEGKECSTPEGKARWKAAPAGEIRIWKEASMGKNMFCTFLVFLIASLLIGYVAFQIPMADNFKDRFQIVGTIGILTYAFSFLPNMIWFQAGKRAIVNGIVDGVLYGLITGAVFSWLMHA